MCADVSEEPAAGIIKKTTLRHIQGDSNLHKHGREKNKTFLEVFTLNKHQALLIITVDRISYATVLPEE
jgi:hypothetical protein